MARSARNQEFLSEIAQQLREGLRKRDLFARQTGKRYTRIDAAKDLNVSRASLQFYLAGTHTPSSDVLRRAMELWGIELAYRGRILTIRDLESPARDNKPAPTTPIQMSLWDSIKGLQKDGLSVTVEKKSPQSITLQVKIGFKAG